jgi:DNA-directed RNA polymerase subunit RPC12/RpoP
MKILNWFKGGYILGRNKGKKIALNNAIVTEINGRIVLIERDELNPNVEVEKLNIDEELKKFENMNLKVIVKESKPKNPREKKETFKYRCGCENEIKSTSDSLHIRCLDCGKEFELKE